MSGNMRWEYKGPISVEDQDHADNMIELHKTEGLPEWTTSWQKKRPADSLAEVLELLGVPSSWGSEPHTVEAHITIELFFDE